MKEKSALPDDVRRSGDSETISRRDVVVRLGVGACALAAAGSAAVTLDFLEPKVLFEPQTRFVAGAPLDFADGTVRFSREQKAYVIGTAGGVYALSAVCTHLGCITRFRSEQRMIACPCHGSQFDLEGNVVHGPAPRSLPWLEVSENASGNLVVDTRVIVPQGTLFRV